MNGFCLTRNTGGLYAQGLYDSSRQMGLGLEDSTLHKTEYPISNKEYPMSKWAVALIEVPAKDWDWFFGEKQKIK
jgi:hypothetical protein